MIPSMKCRSPIPVTLMQTPQKDTATTMFHCRHHAFFFVLLVTDAGSLPPIPHLCNAHQSRVQSPSSLLFFTIGPGKF
ncbi:unnamed protein product [Staurois parvus]|uniref:Uncharacterized protein n=1 Tax=Staurois parvus TaxID=386267 RepID=A0ABN9DSE9_9NEOB|nr:unnamed protein product [Staurois parvus]